MVNEVLIWEKFYKGLIPSEYWNFNLQYDLAKEATQFYILYNTLKLVNIDTMVEPYKFTRKDVADELEYILGINILDFELSPNNDGGMLATYMGDNGALIFTAELHNDYTLFIEFIHNGVMGKVTYSYELDKEFKRNELEKYLNAFQG